MKLVSGFPVALAAEARAIVGELEQGGVSKAHGVLVKDELIGLTF